MSGAKQSKRKTTRELPRRAQSAVCDGFSYLLSLMLATRQDKAVMSISLQFEVSAMLPFATLVTSLCCESSVRGKFSLYGVGKM